MWYNDIIILEFRLLVEKYSNKITMLKENLWKIIFLNLMIQLKKM